MYSKSNVTRIRKILKLHKFKVDIRISTRISHHVYTIKQNNVYGCIHLFVF
jgi:hypothetical protein